MDVSTIPEEADPSKGSASSQGDALTNPGYQTTRDMREALCGREELYHLIFNQAGDAIELIDAETLRFIEVNDAVCRLLGYERDELMHLSLLDIQADPDEAGIRANLAWLSQTGGKLRLESRHRRKDGGILDVQVSVQAFRLHDRDCFVGVWHDSGTETAARTALVDEAEWRRALIEHSRDGIAIFDHEHRLIEANPKFAELLGYTPDELIGLHSWDVDAKATEADIRAGFADPLAVNTLIQTRHRRKDGRLYDAEVSIQGAHIGGRNVFISSTRDISAQKRAEQALRESEERYRSLVESLPDIVYSFSDKRGGVVWSERVEAVLGYSLAELKANPYLWNQSIHPDDRSRVQAVIAAFKQGAHFDLEYRIQDRWGHWHWLRDRSIQRRVVGDEVIIDGLASDITEHKRAEQALVEAKLTAEAATAAKSDFLAHMSHELRTPLNAVIGLTQVLEQADLPPEQCSLVQRIRLAGRAMLQISNDILDLAKIEANQLAIESRLCTLSGLLQRLESLHGEAARAKGLALEIAPAPALSGRVLTDPLRLEQILTNLISNAVKFTDQGAVRVGIEPLAITEQSACLRFRVEDTGIGIAPEALEHLFTPFAQADSSITRRFGGTGLGLSISKRLVELMGGAIGVESREGQGSTFWFELVLERVAAGADDLSEATLAPRPRGRRLEGLTVLAVDDNTSNLEVITRLLALEGANAVPARHGREALEQLQAHPWRFDAVLMDVQMPVMDGLSATRAIRQELKRPALPVIALSAGVLREEQQRAREAGCNDFLAKPVELEHLVERLLRRVGARVSASAPPEHEPDATDRSESSAPLPSPVPGIDPERLAQLTQGDPALTRRLLCRFLSDIDDIPRLVQTDLAQGACASAAARLHGLRGAAANLGAMELARRAGALEETVKTDGPVDEAALTAHATRFDECFATLHRELMVYLGEQAPARPLPSASESAASVTTLDADKLHRFRAALSANRPQPARRLFAELQSDLIAVYGEQTTQTLALALEGLRFSEVLDVLEAAHA
ncbi:PAS domain S-box protein [Allochromatium humboldtianum]|uniref:histidine kinase n=1 Tax=Allochromatium humboldtianum TaxID=504901 RepID=A0A850R5V5_9GAMM|nr:PAS domain S-box protein [Allochromatium humboldtianum]NVZ09114.1 PAS domain S-box protein [Allochromatium humboldtianum]